MDWENDAAGATKKAAAATISASLRINDLQSKTGWTRLGRNVLLNFLFLGSPFFEQV
jgi:hypothetical protein